MSSFRALVVFIGILSLFTANWSVNAPSAQAGNAPAAQAPSQAPAQTPAQPPVSARGSGVPFVPLGDYVPCLFSTDEAAGMRVLRPQPQYQQPAKAIGPDTTLRVMDAMNAAIAKVIEGYGPPPPPVAGSTQKGEAPDKNADLRLFVEEFAQRFFQGADVHKLQDETPIDAYASLSNSAREVANTMVQAIQSKTSTYDYFGYRTKTAGGAQPPADVQTALTQVQNAILSAVRNASTEALEPKPAPLYVPPSDISCSVSVMSWKETSDTFGRRVADQFLAIQVTVRNLNTKNEFLMHDIQVAVDTGLSSDGQYWESYAGRFQAGRDKLLVRAVAQRGQSEDRRNLVLNSLLAIGAIAGSSSIAGSSDFKSAVAVFQGAFIPGYSTLFPDHTVEQLNHINDLVFSASNTSKVIVPIQGSVPLVTFIALKPIGQLPFAWCGYQNDPQRPCLYDIYDWQDEGFPHESFLKGDGSLQQITSGWKPLVYSRWKPAALRILQNHLFVVIGGVHIQQLTGEPVKIANLDCPTLPGGAVDITQTKDGVVVCNVSGTSLDKISSVNLEKGTEKIAGKIKAAKDGNSATLEFDPSALSDGDGIYALELVTKDTSGNAAETDSAEKISLSIQTFVASVDPQLDLSKGPTVSLTLTGKHLNRIAHLYLVPSDGAPVEATGSFAAAPSTTIDKGLVATFATTGTSGLSSDKTYYLRYTLTDQLGKQINLTSLTVKTINKAPASTPSNAPAITKLSVTSGAVGTPVTITGTGFGEVQGTSTVTFNGVKATPTSWGATTIVAPVPAEAKTGDVVVTVGGMPSKAVKFTVGSVPVIQKLSTTSGPAGTTVTITGTNFGGSQGTSAVTFNGVKATPTSWGATAIVVPVPAGAKTGNVIVKVGGVASKGVKFTVP